MAAVAATIEAVRVWLTETVEDVALATEAEVVASANMVPKTGAKVDDAQQLPS